MGDKVTLSEFFGKKNVVLYFYPKDETPGCTREACSFRDSYQELTNLGAEVLGVSGQSIESHKSFATHYGLPFILLSDEDNAVRKLYGVPSSLGILPGRVTYIIDKQGVVRHIFLPKPKLNGTWKKQKLCLGNWKKSSLHPFK